MSMISSTDNDLVEQARRFAEVLAENSRARQFIEALSQRVEALESDIVVMNSVTSRMSSASIDMVEIEKRLASLEEKVAPMILDLPMLVRDTLKGLR